MDTSTWIYLSEGEGHSYGATCRSLAIYEPVKALICYPHRYARTMNEHLQVETLGDYCWRTLEVGAVLHTLYAPYRVMLEKYPQHRHRETPHQDCQTFYRFSVPFDSVFSYVELPNCERSGHYYRHPNCIYQFHPPRRPVVIHAPSSLWDCGVQRASATCHFSNSHSTLEFFLVLN